MANLMTHYPTQTRSTTKWGAAAVLAAAGLAASFLYVRAKAQQVEQDNPPEGKFIEVDGVRLHYTERGQGPALVLLHGNGVFARDFDTSGLAARAGEQYRVIAFDRPGYGHSERPRSTIWTPAAQAKLLHKALRRMGVDQPVVLGHSWGTLVALAMAIEFPDDVRGLVLLSGYYYPSLRLDAPMSSPPAIPLLGDLLRFTISPLLGRMVWPLAIKRMFSPAEVPERFQSLPVWMMLRPSQLRASAAESALMIPSAIALSRHYRELKMPVLIMAGRDDKIVSADYHSGRLHGTLDQSKLRLVPGLGHMLHYGEPDDIVNAIGAMFAPAALPQAAMAASSRSP